MTGRQHCRGCEGRSARGAAWRLGVLAVVLLCPTGYGAAQAAAAAKEGTFYKRPALFSYRPSDTARVVSIDRFGPVGMGIELHQPAFVMKIKNVEKGSPAGSAGTLKAGQTIESINGDTLRDIDPRIQLGRIIADAEASDDVVKFVIRDDRDAPEQEVVVTIPVLGAYSRTWPLNCPKSDKIVRTFADHYAAKGGGGQVMLVLLSTGEEKDLDVVTRWARRFAAGYKDGKKRARLWSRPPASSGSTTGRTGYRDT
jgi:hypothetical protein